MPRPKITEGKRARERKKREKAALKRERRDARAADTQGPDAGGDTGSAAISSAAGDDDGQGPIAVNAGSDSGEDASGNERS